MATRFSIGAHTRGMPIDRGHVCPCSNPQVGRPVGGTDPSGLCNTNPAKPADFVPENPVAKLDFLAGMASSKYEAQSALKESGVYGRAIPRRHDAASRARARRARAGGRRFGAGCGDRALL